MNALEHGVPEGYKQTDVGIIPEDWNVESLKEITIDMLQGINTAIDKPEYVFSGIPILKANNVIDKVVALKNADQISQRSYTNYSERFKIKNGDFLFSNIGARLGTGALWLHDTQATFAWNIMRIIPNQSKVNPSFLAQLINSPQQSERIQGEQSGSGMGFIPKSTMQKQLLPLPCIEEQTAIANALSDVDALLTELEKLIAKKQAIKTATMQQLLTGKTRLPQFATYTEGEKQGQCKGTKPSELGEIPEDWDVIELGDKTVFVGSGKTSTKEKGEFPLFGSTGQIGTCKNDDYKGDSLLIARVGANAGTLNFVTGNYGVSDNTIIIKLQKDVDITFYKYLLIRKNLNSLVFGSGQPLITGSQLKSLKVVCPKFEEQTAIATILSDMDNEIQTLEQRLAKTRQIKQGMMQELLTGRTRLPFDKD
ncbi:restriction endonuclease subunit S [Pseudoalteromonas sp.]|uniref:restriction endonuclease subunit S n=1 Tax=Pseudoalteromonas sp. TaxID=53249 RepID=UPI00351147DF